MALPMHETNAITIIVPLRMCICARSRLAVGANGRCKTRVHIRVFPEIVYRFVGFPIGKQSHPSANERVMFTLPPVASSFSHVLLVRVCGGSNA